MTQKSLDRKLAAIHADPSGCREFILADAKDADMAFGMGAPGQSPERHDGELRFRTLAEYREQRVIAVAHGVASRVLRGIYAGLERDVSLSLPVWQDRILELRAGVVAEIAVDGLDRV